MRLAPLILLALLASGCATTPPVPAGTLPANATVIEFTPSLAQGTREWVAELAHRFKGAVIVSAHGETDPFTGRWFLYPDKPLRAMDAETVAQFVRETNRGRPVVMLACNPKGERLHVAGVWYARSNVSRSPKWYTDFDVHTAEGFIEGKP